MRGSGTLSVKEKTFEAHAAGDKVSLESIDAARSLSTDVSGALSFQFSGSGSLEHPDLKISASLNSRPS